LEGGKQLRGSLRASGNEKHEENRGEGKGCGIEGNSKANNYRENGLESMMSGRIRRERRNIYQRRGKKILNTSCSIPGTKKGPAYHLESSEKFQTKN